MNFLEHTSSSLLKLGVIRHNKQALFQAFKLPDVNSIANFVSTLPNVVGFLGLCSHGQMSQTRFSQSLLVLCVSI